MFHDLSMLKPFGAFQGDGALVKNTMMKWLR